MIVHIEYPEYKTKVISKLNERVKELSKSVHTVWDHEDFVKYCYEHFEHTDSEIEKCSIGLLIMKCIKNLQKYLAHL